MDRLTWEYKDGGMFVDGKEIKISVCDGVPVCTGNAIIKLAKYEDTGLEPEEIACCINLLKDKCWACSNARAYRIGNSSLKTCKYRMKGCVAATAQPECEHWTLDVGCLHKAEPQKETKGCSGECDLCPEADGCEQCGSV